MKNAGTRSSSTAATIFAARAPEFYLFHNQPANKIVDGAGRGVIGIKIDTPALLPAALGLSPRVVCSLYTARAVKEYGYG